MAHPVHWCLDKFLDPLYVLPKKFHFKYECYLLHIKKKTLGVLYVVCSLPNTDAFCLPLGSLHPIPLLDVGVQDRWYDKLLDTSSCTLQTPSSRSAIHSYMLKKEKKKAIVISMTIT